MARINGIDIDEIKAKRIQKYKDQTKEIKRMRKESEQVDSVKKDYEHTTNVLDIYNNLSDEEKKVLDKQL